MVIYPKQPVSNIISELQNDNAFIKGKIGVIEQERKRLVQESEQYKIYIENLKQSLNERSLSEPSCSPLKFSAAVSK